jgi:predicted component of type VI protein secretion system
MSELILEWNESGQVRTQSLTEQQATKSPGVFRIGRDPTRCDVVLQHPTVSGLHVEIFFDSRQNQFYLRNLRESNPPVVDQQRVTQGSVALYQNSLIRLGQFELRIKAIASQLQPTVLTPPTSPASPAPVAAPQNESYGLECPKCHRVSPHQHLRLGCPWCGTSLAAAQSVLIMPE